LNPVEWKKDGGLHNERSDFAQSAGSFPNDSSNFVNNNCRVQEFPQKRMRLAELLHGESESAPMLTRGFQGFVCRMLQTKDHFCFCRFAAKVANTVSWNSIPVPTLPHPENVFP